MSDFTPPPNQDYTAPPGHDASYVAPVSPTVQPTTFADISALQTAIVTAQGMISQLGQQLTSAIIDQSISVNDPTLQAAIDSEWPSEIGEPPPNYVTFSYYNYLGNINSSAATLIRNAYESAMQDTGGNDAIDLLPVLALIDQEISLIDSFATNNLSGLNDSAEQRVCENFQDFVSSATTHLQNIQYVFISQATPLPDSETSLLSKNDAANAQALFKVNLNKLNTQINQDLQTLHANFAQHASDFYGYFLGPALSFRQNVSSQILPIYPGTLGAHLEASTAAANNNMNQSLMDQTARNYFFDSQVVDVLNAIRQRDSYRDHIEQLSISSGIAVTSLVMTQSDSQAALGFFESYVPPTSTSDATPSFTASHAELGSTLDPSAHPQYLLSSGDTITGDIAVSEGVSVGGIVLNQHAHTGTDGSALIDGAHIMGGTLGPAVINPNETPTVPQNFMVTSTSIEIFPGGVFMGTVNLSWDGDPGLQFEVQAASLGSATPNGTV